jgi:hypothetical protein
MSFIAVSPRGNTYLFSYTFIVNETTNTLKWLFNYFSTVMDGVPLVPVIVDGDRAMKIAIDTMLSTHGAFSTLKRRHTRK